MNVLDLDAYDANLGYDWLTLHIPMLCHWDIKKLEFVHRGSPVTLQGIQSKLSLVYELSSDQLFKCLKGNEI